ncbi:MAG: hypothetical protein D6746_05140 [Bacteroidetes bacterium]|nr:MAG: hypothetical protein D6746_05140 [Bacteroidota bacterium]
MIGNILWFLFGLSAGMALYHVQHMAHDMWLLDRAWDTLLVIMLCAMLPAEMIIKKYILPVLAALLTAYIFGLVTNTVLHAIGVTLSTDDGFDDIMVSGIWAILAWDSILSFFKGFNHFDYDYMA